MESIDYNKVCSLYNFLILCFWNILCFMNINIFIKHNIFAKHRIRNLYKLYIIYIIYKKLLSLRSHILGINSRVYKFGVL